MFSLNNLIYHFVSRLINISGIQETENKTQEKGTNKRNCLTEKLNFRIFSKKEILAMIGWNTAAAAAAATSESCSMCGIIFLATTGETRFSFLLFKCNNSSVWHRLLMLPLVFYIQKKKYFLIPSLDTFSPMSLSLPNKTKRNETKRRQRWCQMKYGKQTK